MAQWVLPTPGGPRGIAFSALSTHPSSCRLSLRARRTLGWKAQSKSARVLAAGSRAERMAVSSRRLPRSLIRAPSRRSLASLAVTAPLSAWERIPSTASRAPDSFRSARIARNRSRRPRAALRHLRVHLQGAAFPLHPWPLAPVNAALALDALPSAGAERLPRAPGPPARPARSAPADAPWSCRAAARESVVGDHQRPHLVERQLPGHPSETLERALRTLGEHRHPLPPARARPTRTRAAQHHHQGAPSPPRQA